MKTKDGLEKSGHGLKNLQTGNYKLQLWNLS